MAQLCYSEHLEVSQVCYPDCLGWLSCATVSTCWYLSCAAVNIWRDIARLQGASGGIVQLCYRGHLEVWLSYVTESIWNSDSVVLK